MCCVLWDPLHSLQTFLLGFAEPATQLLPWDFFSLASAASCTHIPVLSSLLGYTVQNPLRKSLWKVNWSDCALSLNNRLLGGKSTFSGTWKALPHWPWAQCCKGEMPGACQMLLFHSWAQCLIINSHVLSKSPTPLPLSSNHCSSCLLQITSGFHDGHFPLFPAKDVSSSSHS